MRWMGAEDWRSWPRLRGSKYSLNGGKFETVIIAGLELVSVRLQHVTPHRLMVE